MRLQVAPCEDGDMDLAFAVISEAFGHEHPYFDYCFPKHDTHEGRKTGGERILAVKNGDPNTTYIKVTDSGTGLIIGVAKWNVYDGVQPEEADLDGPYWDSDSDKRLAQEMWAGYLLPRRQAIKDTGGKLVCNTVISGRNYNLADTGGKALDMMCVHPSYQRAGAGHLLLEWGVDIADEKGLKTVVEATRPGRALYASEGFEVSTENYVVQLSQEFQHKATQSFTWMYKLPKSNGA